MVSPTILKETEAQFGPFFPGMIPVEGWKVGQAYKRATLGAQAGHIYKVVELTQRLFEDRRQDYSPKQQNPYSGNLDF